MNAILDAEIGRNISVNNQLATANQMSFEILKDSFKMIPDYFLKHRSLKDMKIHQL